MSEPTIDLSAQLRALNSLTKYPSIPTYHTINHTANGQTLCEPCMTINGPVTATEKIDGTNGRIVLVPGASKKDRWSYLIGSREEFVYAKGDLLGDPQQGIWPALKPIADSMVEYRAPERLIVAFVEVYGGKINGAREYTTTGAVGVRLFDVASIHDWQAILGWPLDRISSWREHGGQRFADDASREAFADHCGFQLVPQVGRWEMFGWTTILDAYVILKETLKTSKVTLDAGARGNPEGMVIRTANRSQIAKLRFEDYERTLEVGRFACQRKKGQL